ncbi:hypothetical protein EV360DRAFT_76235 [Lentinula raphanica]|nr:hypothetical protein EV360DRAFT_76235 [Lentinula raphanica]
MFEVMSRKPASNKQLLLFEQDPDHHGPSLTATALDTSHGTALEMVNSPWNQQLIKILASKASDTGETSGRSDIFNWRIDWNAFFEKFIYRVLVHIERECAEEGVAQVTHHDDSGDDESQVETGPMRQSRIRIDMKLMKLKRWLNLCSVMIRVCREQQDAHGVSVWSDIMLFRISEHCVEETSEEEDDNNATPPHARLVKYIVLGHPKSRGKPGVDNGMQDREKFEFRNSGVDCLHRTKDWTQDCRRTSCQTP